MNKCVKCSNESDGNLCSRCMEKDKNKFTDDFQMAKLKLGEAIRSGEVVKENCSVCGSDRTFAIQEDIQKPLDVDWLCSDHIE